MHLPGPEIESQAEIPGIFRAAESLLQEDLFRPAMAAAEKLAGERFPEAAAPDADEESRAEEEYRIEAGAAFPRPVQAILEIQPKGKFVQGECGADTIEQGHKAAREERSAASAGTDFHEPAEPHGQQDQDSPDQMMHVRAANNDVMKRSDIARGCECGGTGKGKRREETRGGQKQAPLGAITDMFVE